MVSLVAMGEGIRLTLQLDPQAVSDVLGPGYYVFFLGAALMVTGIIYLVVYGRKKAKVEKGVVSGPMRKVMITMIAVMAIYTFLIEITGYLVATLFFFLVEFRVIGVKSWVTNILLTIAFTAVYYFVFLRCCAMVFPRGIFFG